MPDVSSIIQRLRNRHISNNGLIGTPPVIPSVGPPSGLQASPINMPDPLVKVHMRHTLRIHYLKFDPKFLPQETIYAMVRNQVVPETVLKGGSPTLIPQSKIDWCEANCSDFWMPSPPNAPEYIMFASAEDMDLFLMGN